MAENSKIQWTHHTFNPWRGCARVSPGCVHCYAETLSKRNPKTLGVWGVDGTRVIASPSMWQQPVKWDIAAQRAGERHRVFCASLADVGEDRPDLVEPRKRLSDLIFRTPNLDWLLLTKRPENMARLFDVGTLKRCWVGVTAENQEYADKRIPILLGIPSRVRFVSYEPAIGPVDFNRRELLCKTWNNGGGTIGTYLDWVIVGGESGGGARPFDVQWARDVVRQCAETKTACFVKQLGKWPSSETPIEGWRQLFNKGDYATATGWAPRSGGSGHGDTVDEWPLDLRVRQFPVVGHVHSVR